jgi:hypothetical protein
VGGGEGEGGGRRGGRCTEAGATRNTEVPRCCVLGITGALMQATAELRCVA